MKNYFEKIFKYNKVGKKYEKNLSSSQGFFKTLFLIFLINLALVGVNKTEISIFLNLKAIKAKKATIVS